MLWLVVSLIGLVDFKTTKMKFSRSNARDDLVGKI